MKFIKHNPTKNDDSLLKEAEGLAVLEEQLQSINSTINIPTVFQVNKQLLVLEQIDQVNPTRNQWVELGHELAQLHVIKQPFYGFNTNNYIGMNPQHNITTKDWGLFFYQYRLMFQINLIANDHIKSEFKNLLTSVENPLIEFLNECCDYPSLLHGDLWSGNVLFNQDSCWLIDPAVYYGDAEADLAMTELFGRFPAAFYQSYIEIKPLSIHYSLKKVIYNLYHQLNHYNLFGSGYQSSCNRGFDIIINHFK